MSIQIPLLTIADLDAMPDDGNRYEVIEGELFVSCAPGLTHQNVSKNLLVSIELFLRRNPVGEVWTTVGVIFSEYSGVIPDLVFVSNERLAEIASGERIEGAPDLVIEIVSPGAENARRDRVAKSQLYAKHRVKEYWIVDPNKRMVEIYTSKGQTMELDSTSGEKDELVSTVIDSFTCEVETIFRVKTR